MYQRRLYFLMYGLGGNMVKNPSKALHIQARGYYRCSSSKGCLARKQVERNRSDPRMFIVTYTAEHNHPAPAHGNSLAGSTRLKALSSPESPDKASLATKPSCSSSPATSLSTNTESREEKDVIGDDEFEQEEDFGGFPGMAVNDEFFSGLEEFASDSPSSDAGDRFPDHFAGSFGLPWFPSSVATMAGGV